MEISIGLTNRLFIAEPESGEFCCAAWTFRPDPGTTVGRRSMLDLSLWYILESDLLPESEDLGFLALDALASAGFLCLTARGTLPSCILNFKTLVSKKKCLRYQ